jgi:hypothetical protein
MCWLDNSGFICAALGLERPHSKVARALALKTPLPDVVASFEEPPLYYH